MVTAHARDQGNVNRWSEDFWMVLAIIQPFRLDAVTLALEASPDFAGMTVSECRGLSDRTASERKELEQERAGPLRHRNSDLDGFDFANKVLIEVAVRGRASAERVVQIIARTAQTGNPGDGKVFAWPLASVISVRAFVAGAPGGSPTFSA